MQLDMDALIDGLLPWDLTLTTRFWSLRTEPPTIGDVALMQQLTQPGHDVGELAALVSRLAGGADVSHLRMEQLLTVLHAVIEHWRETVAKNSSAIAPAVQAAMAAAGKSSTSGSSTRPC